MENSSNNKNNTDDINILKKKLKEQRKEREKSESETLKLEKKLKALKYEENKAWKKIENVKSIVKKLEDVRKAILNNKIIKEELKSSHVTSIFSYERMLYSISNLVAA